LNDQRLKPRRKLKEKGSLTKELFTKLRDRYIGTAFTEGTLKTHMNQMMGLTSKIMTDKVKGERFVADIEGKEAKKAKLLTQYEQDVNFRNQLQQSNVESLIMLKKQTDSFERFVNHYICNRPSRPTIYTIFIVFNRNIHQ
jgi:hypothetical protein